MLQDGEKGVIIQRDKKTYAVAPHIPCGLVRPEQLRRLAEIAEKYQAQALKITSAARIAIVGVDEKDIDNIWLCKSFRSQIPYAFCWYNSLSRHPLRFFLLKKRNFH